MSKIRPLRWLSLARSLLVAMVIITALPAAAQTRLPPDVRLDTLIEQDRMLASIAFRIATANADLCPSTKPVVGWSLHAASQYGGELRPIAEARFGLSGDLPGVAGVSDDSPAAVAGLMVGDLILSVNGTEMSEHSSGEAANYDGMAANLAVIGGSLAVSQGAIIRIRRGSDDLILDLIPTVGCGYPVHLDLAEPRLLRADGKAVFVGTLLIAHLQGDEGALAFGIAHGLAATAFGNPPDNSHRALAEADRVGAYLAVRAGYDLNAARRLFAVANQLQTGRRRGLDDRLRRLETTIADIEAARAANQPLLP